MAKVTYILQDTGQQKTAQAKAGQNLLEVALANDIDIEHACGGVCGCSTCHVWIREGMLQLSPPSDQELDLVDQAADVKPNSRLACQCRILRDDATIVCEVPAWNRNLVKESPH